MGAAESSNLSGGASSRGWSGSSYSTSSMGTDAAPSMSSPHLIRRMSKGTGDMFPSLKLTDTLMPHQTPNPAQPSHPSESHWHKSLDDDAQPLSGGAQQPLSGKMPSPPKMTRALSAPASTSSSSSSTSDIQQPTSEMGDDHFTSGDQRSRMAHQPHMTWMTHPHLKSGKGDHIAQPTPATAPLAQNVQSFSKRVLGLTGGQAQGATATDSTSAKSITDKPFLSSTLGASLSARAPLRRMSTGSLLPAKESPFDAQPDDLHRAVRLGRYYAPTSDATEGAAGATPPRRRASLSAEAADRFAGGFPW